MRKHLAILTKTGINAIFNRSKIIESRFSKAKLPPYGVIDVGDVVYLKPSGEDIVGKFTVTKVISFANLSPDDWILIRREYGRAISLGSKSDDEAYFNAHKDAKYATLIFFDALEKFITSPIKITKKDLRGWVVLD